MHFVTVMEQAPRLMRSLEALTPYLSSYLSTVRGWRSYLPGSRVTPWPLIGTAFGAGLAVGAIGGMLMAPKSGAELRQDVRKQLGSKMGALADRTRTLAEKTHVQKLFQRSKSNGHATAATDVRPSEDLIS